jgi:phosphoglycerate kinase
MKPIAEHLSHILRLPVATVANCIGNEVSKEVAKLKDGDILFLENLRFHPGEETNDANFASELASVADVYINDAFGTAHRVHASTVGVAKHLPAVAGFLMETELKEMNKLLNDPARPFACVIGGAKISGKIGLMQNMLKKVDVMLVGGGMVATFLKAQGYDTGQSLVENDKLEIARNLLKEAKEQEISLVLPVDVVISKDLKTNTSSCISSICNLPADVHIVDIGPETINLFSQALDDCHTIMWNGPLGIYEIPEFSKGTRAMAQFLAGTRANTVIGGGSTVETIREMGLVDMISHVSTGGGASLKFLEGKTLPGVAVLQDK